jgi:Zn-dependent protease
MIYLVDFKRETYKQRLCFLPSKGAQRMKCRKCGKETFLPFRCPYCGDQFCTEHRLPENHNCPRMDLARAQRHEDAVMRQGPNSYEYKVTYGMPRRTRGRVYFSPKELKHLAVAVLLVIGVGVSYIFFIGSLGGDLALVASASAAIFTSSFVIHEIAHKVTAQRRGLWAEFRLTLWGSVLTAIFIVLPVAFKIISPGAVMISGPASMDEIGKISIAGPTTNMVLSATLVAAALLPTPISWVFVIGAFFNGYIAVFNLIPIGILDGYKIFNWNKTVWALAFAASVTLTAASYFLFAAIF